MALLRVLLQKRERDLKPLSLILYLMERAAPGLEEASKLWGLLGGLCSLSDCLAGRL